MLILIIINIISKHKKKHELPKLFVTIFVGLATKSAQTMVELQNRSFNQILLMN